MNESEAANHFCALSPTKQASFLALLAHHLTACARATDLAEIGTEPAALRLLALNGIQQTVTGQLALLISDDNKRYPGEIFIKVLFEGARKKNNESDLEWALKLASRSTDVTNQ